MLALLGLLAVAGYQNRDRIKEVLGNIGQGGMNNLPGGGLGGLGASGGLGGLLGNWFGSANAGQTMHGGLTDLINTVTGNGHGEVAQSWVQTGANKEISPQELESALGNDTITELSSHTGLSREELLSRLQTVLPKAVDGMTPQGRVPAQSETTDWLRSLAA
jgi:uncharacterized protein YidB (DUF937 family)